MANLTNHQHIHSESQQNKMLCIAARGKFRAELDIKPTQSASRCSRATDELIRYLERSVGDKLPLTPRRKPARIRLTLEPTLNIGGEAFECRVNENTAEIKAKTTTGIEHGVHWFLEKFVGVRWLWPGVTGEVVPTHTTLQIPLGTWREEPDFAWRRIGLGGSLLERHDYDSANRRFLGLEESHRIDFEQWAWRNRLGGINIADGHLLNEMLSAEKLGSEHPDYFALVDNKRDSVLYNGKHNNQPCTTNPDTLNYIANEVTARFKTDATLDAISIGMNDGWRMCECDQCRALDQQYEAQDANYDAAPMAADIDPPTICHVDGSVRIEQSLTDRLFKYVNDVWHKVAETCPDKKLLMLIYAACRTPPTQTRLPDQVIAQFCTMCNRYTNAQWRKRELQHLQELSGYASEIGIYEYYEQGAWPAITRLFPKLITQSIQDFHQAGARYFATQPGYGFATNGLNFFTLARSLWNINTDADETLRDYCTAAFGPAAAPAMQRYFEAFERRWIESDALQNIDARHPLLGLDKLYPDVFLNDRKSDLIESLEKCQNGNQRSRIAFIQKGFDFTCAVHQAFSATAQLQNTLATDLWTDEFADSIPDSPSTQQRQFLHTAMECWKKAEATAERYKGEFVYSEFWFYYMPNMKNWPRTQYWQRPLRLLEKAWGPDPSNITVVKDVPLKGQPNNIR